MIGRLDPGFSTPQVSMALKPVGLCLKQRCIRECTEQDARQQAKSVLLPEVQQVAVGS